MDNFAGATVVVTGAGSGIGRALARGFAAEGATVAAADIDGAAAAATAKMLGAAATAHQVDVGDAAAVDAFADEVFEAHQHVDVLINNAGVFQGGLMWERSPHDWRWVFDVNVFGIANGVRSFIPRMLAQGTEGHVLNTASVAAFVAGAASSPYVVSKCAALSMSECLAHDLAAVGSSIGVSVLTPSAFDTGIAHTARVRPDSYSTDTTADGKMTVDGLAAMTSTGMSPDAIVPIVLKGIRARQFLIATRPSFENQIRNRYEALLRCTIPGPVTVD